MDRTAAASGLVARDALLDTRRDDADAEGLGQHQRVAGLRPGVAEDAMGINQTRHCRAVLDLRVVHRVAAEQGDARLRKLRQAAAQDAVQNTDI